MRFCNTNSTYLSRNHESNELDNLIKLHNINA
nr:MAG TPA: hypothetical protein [Caudoviricetes sp.]